MIQFKIGEFDVRESVLQYYSARKQYRTGLSMHRGYRKRKRVGRWPYFGIGKNPQLKNRTGIMVENCKTHLEPLSTWCLLLFLVVLLPNNLGNSFCSTTVYLSSNPS